MLGQVVARWSRISFEGTRSDKAKRARIDANLACQLTDHYNSNFQRLENELWADPKHYNQVEKVDLARITVAIEPWNVYQELATRTLRLCSTLQTSEKLVRFELAYSKGSHFAKCKDYSFQCPFDLIC